MNLQLHKFMDVFRYTYIYSFIYLLNSGHVRTLWYIFYSWSFNHYTCRSGFADESLGHVSHIGSRCNI